MHTYELYINGKIVDLSDDSNITLLFQSPIFSELDSIQSNRSYEISLPPTGRNRAIFDNCDRIDVFGRLPYTKLPAMLYMDGVMIFDSGFAVVTGIDEGINIALTWGNVDNFQPLFDENLSELDFGEDGVLAWNDSTEISGYMPQSGIGFVRCNFFPDSSAPFSNKRYVHPSITVNRILQAIQARHGIVIEDAKRLYNQLAVPLSRLNQEGQYLIPSCGDSQMTIGGTTYRVLSVWNVTALEIMVKGKSDQGYEVYWKFDVRNATNFRLKVSTYKYRAPFFIWSDKPSWPIVYVLDAESGQIIANISSYLQFFEYNSAQSGYLYTLPDCINIDVSDVNYIAFATPVLNNAMYSFSTNPFIISIENEITSFDVGQFAVSPNLPDMSQGEFINQLLKLQGLFAYPDTKEVNTIKLLSVDDIMNGEIIDWSSRVIVPDKYDVARAEASEFANDDFGQTNTLDYDNDEDVEIKTAGYIYIDDKNLDKEKELVELEFSASMNKSLTEQISGFNITYNCAVVPIYSKRDGSNDVEYNDVNPRILTLSGGGAAVGLMPYPYLSFPTSMHFGGDSGIVATKYASYAKILQDYRLVTVQMKLSPVDLAEFSFKNRIYLDCFGQVFALYSIETSDTDICEVKLLRLKD